MIFGFNTDVKVGDVVYHVQSEARQKELLLETQVFVRGRCIAKCTSPFPEEETVLLDFAEDSVQESLTAQHRRVVDSVRDGTLEQDLAGDAVLRVRGDAGRRLLGLEQLAGPGRRPWRRCSAGRRSLRSDRHHHRRPHYKRRRTRSEE